MTFEQTKTAGSQGISQLGFIRIFTDSDHPLYTSRHPAVSKADQIKWDDRFWEITDVSKWELVLPHYKSVAQVIAP
jgi:hypothetical protein